MKTWAILIFAFTVIFIAGCSATPEADVLQATTTPEVTAEPTATVTPLPTTKPTRTPAPTREARPYPDFFTFSSTDPDGVEFSVESYRGQPFMMLFFSVRCSHCQSEAEHLEELYQAYQDQGLKIVAFEASGADNASVLDFAQTYGLTFPVLSENNQSFAYKMGVVGVPANFFISPDGEVFDTMIGFKEVSELQRAIESLLEN